MAVLTTETWTGTDGAAWPASPNTWTHQGSWSGEMGFTAVIAGNQGSMLPSVGAYYAAHSALTSLSVANCELYVEFTLPGGTLAEDYLAVGVRSDGTYNGELPNTGYAIYVNCGSTSGSIDLRVGNGTGSGTILVAGIAQTYAAGGSYAAKLSAIGDTISAKVWQISATPETEPAWEASVTDTTFPSAGYITLNKMNGNTTRTAALWDNMTVTDGAADYPFGVTTPTPRYR